MIDKLDAIIQGMTKGPLYANQDDLIGGWDVGTRKGWPSEGPFADSVGSFLSEEDARGFATLRNVAPELLAVARAAETVRDLPVKLHESWCRVSYSRQEESRCDCRMRDINAALTALNAAVSAATGDIAANVEVTK